MSLVPRQGTFCQLSIVSCQKTRRRSVVLCNFVTKLWPPSTNHPFASNPRNKPSSSLRCAKRITACATSDPRRVGASARRRVGAEGRRAEKTAPNEPAPRFGPSAADGAAATSTTVSRAKGTPSIARGALGRPFLYLSNLKLPVWPQRRRLCARFLGNRLQNKVTEKRTAAVCFLVFWQVSRRIGMQFVRAAP